MLSIIMMLCGIVLGILLMPLANLYTMSKWFIGLEGYIVLISLSYLLYSILNIFMFPMLFWLGYQKGKFWGFYLPMIFFSLALGACLSLTYLPGNTTIILDFIIYTTENIYKVTGAVFVAATILLICSYLLSVKLYSGRDF